MRHRLAPPVLMIVMIAACAAPPLMPSQQPTPSATEVASGSPRPSAIDSILPTAAPSGFAFSVEGVVGYYEGLGYACSPPQPSSTAANHAYQSCVAQDPDGRALVVGLVTDPNGRLADAFASVEGTPDETILAPTAALDPLASFLGAMLGEDRGSALLIWLAGHLGDEYAETTDADLRVATYTQSASDHSRLFVEIANEAYLDAPTPAPS